MSNSFAISTPGRVATEPTLRYGDDARPRVYFRLAVDDMTRDTTGEWVKRQAVFHDVVAFGKSAERYAAALTVGDPIVVAGDLRFNTYTAKDGEERTGSQVVATAIGPDLRMCDVTIDRTRRTDGPSQAAGMTGPEAATVNPSTHDAPANQPASKIKQPPDQQTKPAAAADAPRAVASPRWPDRLDRPVSNLPTMKHSGTDGPNMRPPNEAIANWQTFR